MVNQSKNIKGDEKGPYKYSDTIDLCVVSCFHFLFLCFCFNILPKFLLFVAFTSTYLVLIFNYSLMSFFLPFLVYHKTSSVKSNALLISNKLTNTDILLHCAANHNVFFKKFQLSMNCNETF